jgi:MFS family permease
MPIHFFFFATGCVVDTFSRKKILIFCAAFDAIVLAGISAVMLSETLYLTVLFSLIFAHGSVMALYFPSSQAIIPNIVSEEQIRQAIALSSTTSNVACTAGPVVAGVLIAVIDLHIYTLMTLLMSLIEMRHCMCLAEVDSPADVMDEIGGKSLLDANRFAKSICQ